MTPVNGTFRTRAAAEIQNEHPAQGPGQIMRKLVDDSRNMLGRSPADARARAAAARAYAIDHLEELHDQFQRQCSALGIVYHRAATAEQAVAIIKTLLAGSRRVAKSKTMVGEEVGLTHALRDAGIDILETDIGEYVVDLEGRGPSHITAPALHLNRARIRDILARAGGDLEDDDPARLSRYVRDIVGNYFKDCDAAITGTNIAIASTGRLIAVENEGNVALGVSHPRVHIAITGLEKVVADEHGAMAILEVLAPSATAQPLTSFTHVLGSPAPGQERHVVFVDNGRSRILHDERYREVLKCIRCGACMNACPVYRVAGGLSYGSPYMGPIGAVVSPLLWPDLYADLPGASSLCGRCTEVCPVGIPLHRMLLDLRADEAIAPPTSSREKTAWRTWSLAFRNRRLGRIATRLGRLGVRGARTAGSPGPAAALPPAAPRERDLSLLVPLVEDPRANLPTPDPVAPSPADLAAFFTMRAESLGIEVVPSILTRETDRVLNATAAIASTGSVLLTDEATERRPLLAAGRVVVHVDPATIVRYPSDLPPHMGTNNALILTGASRTADIEKQIVRGIHGAEDLVVVLASRA